MKKLIKRLFINPVIENAIAKQEIKRMNTVNTIHSKMSQKDKAHLFCIEKEIQYAIDVLNEMIK